MRHGAGSFVSDVVECGRQEAESGNVCQCPVPAFVIHGAVPFTGGSFDAGSTPNRLRSKANAVINLMGAVGGVYALIMIKMLVGAGERPDYLPLFLSIGGLMILAVAVLFVTVRERKVAQQVAEEEAGSEAVYESGNAGQGKRQPYREERRKGMQRMGRHAEKTGPAGRYCPSR